MVKGNWERRGIKYNCFVIYIHSGACGIEKGRGEIEEKGKTFSKERKLYL